MHALSLSLSLNPPGFLRFYVRRLKPPGSLASTPAAVFSSASPTPKKVKVPDFHYTGSTTHYSQVQPPFDHTIAICLWVVAPVRVVSGGKLSSVLPPLAFFGEIEIGGRSPALSETRLTCTSFVSYCCSFSISYNVRWLDQIRDRERGKGAIANMCTFPSRLDCSNRREV